MRITTLVEDGCASSCSAVVVGRALSQPANRSDSRRSARRSVFARFRPRRSRVRRRRLSERSRRFAKGYGIGEHRVRRADHAADAVHHGLRVQAVHRGRDRAARRAGPHSLDDDVRKYVPELPDYGKKITIDQLVHHTSGMRDFWALVRGVRDATGRRLHGRTTSCSWRRGRRISTSIPAPSTTTATPATSLLGVIVQRVTGKTLRQFAAEQIFAPLGMTISHFHDDHNSPFAGARSRTVRWPAAAGRSTCGTTTSSARAV